VSGLGRDAGLIVAARATRTFGHGFLAVVLGVYLAEAGRSVTEIGALLSLALAGDCTLTVAVSVLADRVGRRRTLIATALLMAGAGLAFLATDHFALLLVAAAAGVVSTTGHEVSPFLALDQAILSQVAAPERRTDVFAWYNVAGSLAGALGALFVGGAGAARDALGLTPGDVYRGLFGVYAAIGVLNVVLFAALSPAVEVADPPGRGRWFPIQRSRRTVAKLASLFALDAFAGGFAVQSLVALWFHARFAVPLDVLGTIFFGASLLSAVSFLVAARVAARVGLINTMVFTHLPASLLLAALPLAPTLPLALAIFLVRQALSQMDVPTRQSYVMAVVAPTERMAAAGVTTLARNVAQAVSPFLAGLTMQAVALGGPFLLGGSLKAAYDLMLFASFRGTPTPEETARRNPAHPSHIQ
jgi:MFS family permease